MREGIGTQSSTRPRILWSGAILLSIGLSVLLLVGEWFAAFDACLANPVCIPPGSVSTLESFLALVLVGVGAAVGGAMIVLVGLQDAGPPRVRSGGQSDLESG
jgi:hypothetical protein